MIGAPSKETETLGGSVIQETVIMRLKMTFQISTSGACLTTIGSYMKSLFRARLRSANSSEAKFSFPVFDQRLSVSLWPSKALRICDITIQERAIK